MRLFRHLNALKMLRSVSAACLACVILANPAAAQTSNIDNLRKLALQLVNKSRAGQKLPPLKLEQKLNQPAQFHADDMLKRNYYAHSSPEGQTVAGRFEAAGGSRWLLMAENIAKCDGCAPPLTKDYVRQMHKGWMESPGHRANILHKGLNTFGFGMAAGQDGRLYAVQTFAGPGTPQVTGATNGSHPLSEQEQAKTALSKINELRKSAGKSPLKLSAALSKAARKIVPTRSDESFKIRQSNDIYAALPEGARKDWASLTLLSASCGGCGVKPVAADVAYFIDQWVRNDRYKAMLLKTEATHLGYAIAANGKGKKVSAGLLGKGR